MDWKSIKIYLDFVFAMRSRGFSSLKGKALTRSTWECFYRGIFLKKGPVDLRILVFSKDLSQAENRFKNCLFF